MKTTILLPILFTASCSAAATNGWEKRSAELAAQPNVPIPQGIYHIRCNDPGKEKFRLAAREKIWRSLGMSFFWNLVTFNIATMAAIPFYYAFKKGALELTKDPRYAIELVVTPSEIVEEADAFRMRIPFANTNGGKFVSEKRLRKAKDAPASYFIAKAAPSYEPSETKNIKIHLQVLTEKGKRWLAAGRRSILSRRRLLKFKKHRFSEWTMELTRSAQVKAHKKPHGREKELPMHKRPGPKR